jgi:hypothetical protein
MVSIFILEKYSKSDRKIESNRLKISPASPQNPAGFASKSARLPSKSHTLKDSNSQDIQKSYISKINAPSLRSALTVSQMRERLDRLSVFCSGRTNDDVPTCMEGGERGRGGVDGRLGRLRGAPCTQCVGCVPGTGNTV